ncbi:Gfo/Idh/MocA family protein [Neglectibacter caecimuris]|uniref:Gfo/Idh/MocA family protein n=1 Tax=Neglectibacter caecimuris TaxID=3093658 RepID=UPI002AC9ABDB|nr:Gfo/Idh/MocA family oxidoreductase [Neglectibacter sp. M00184]
MKRLKCAIVGCGGIAQVHAAVLHEQDTAELLASCDIRPERAEALAGAYGGAAYSSLEELLERERPEVLHICTPHVLHTPMAKLAAERGIAVFTEKPPVINETQWKEFQELGEKTRVGVCFQNRYNPGVGLLKELLASGKLGKLLGGRAFVTWHRDASYYTESGWRGSLETEGGGVLINQSIHTLDLLGQFLGRAVSVDATMTNHHLKNVIEVEDAFEASIDFGGSPAVFFATTAHCTDSPVLVELVCENATVRMEEQEVTLLWKNGGREFHRLPEPLSPITGKAYWGQSHSLCIADFYHAVLEETPFRNDIPGVADTVELMLAAYRSAREHREVLL